MPWDYQPLSYKKNVNLYQAGNIFQHLVCRSRLYFATLFHQDGRGLLTTEYFNQRILPEHNGYKSPIASKPVITYPPSLAMLKHPPKVPIRVLT